MFGEHDLYGAKFGSFGALGAGALGFAVGVAVGAVVAAAVGAPPAAAVALGWTSGIFPKSFGLSADAEAVGSAETTGSAVVAAGAAVASVDGSAAAAVVDGAAEAAAAEARLRAHPLVEAAFAAFPDAELVSDDETAGAPPWRNRA